MKKWVWMIILILMGFTVTIIGCKSVKNLDDDPTFKPMIGKVLRTKKDLVVIDFRGSKKTLALVMPGASGVPETKEIPQQLPADYYDATIYGVFLAGSTVQIVHIEYVKTFEFSFTDFYAIVTSEGDFKGKKLDIGAMTNQNTRVPTFDTQYVEEISLPQ